LSFGSQTPRQKDRLATISPRRLSLFCLVGSPRLLLPAQPSRPNPARPVAKRGSVAWKRDWLRSKLPADETCPRTPIILASRRHISRPIIKLVTLGSRSL